MGVQHEHRGGHVDDPGADSGGVGGSGGGGASSGSGWLIGAAGIAVLAYAALTADGMARALAVVALAGLAALLWFELRRHRKVLLLADGVLDDALDELLEAERLMRKGASFGTYASHQSDAIMALLDYSERVSRANLAALKRLAELDPVEAVRMADESTAAAAVLTERMPDLAAAQAEFLRGHEQ